MPRSSTYLVVSSCATNLHIRRPRKIQMSMLPQFGTVSCVLSGGGVLVLCGAPAEGSFGPSPATRREESVAAFYRAGRTPLGSQKGLADLEETIIALIATAWYPSAVRLFLLGSASDERRQ